MKKIPALLLFGLLSLTACISGVKEPDSYTDRTGKTTVIESDHEMCVRSCNEDYSRCMDTEPAQTSGFHDLAPGMIGASADCRNTLRDCLPGCEAR